jgi:Zn-dependent M32 family carboxypeptidase
MILEEIVSESEIFRNNVRLLPNEFEKFKRNYESLSNKHTAKKDKDGVWWGFRKGQKEADWRYMEDSSYGSFKLLTDLDQKQVFAFIRKRSGWKNLFESINESSENKKVERIIKSIYPKTKPTVKYSEMYDEWEVEMPYISTSSHPEEGNFYKLSKDLEKKLGNKYKVSFRAGYNGRPDILITRK